MIAQYTTGSTAFFQSLTSLFQDTFITQRGDLFQIRALNPEADLAMICQWVNAPEAIPFWQMNESEEHIRETYEKLLSSGLGYSFIGFFNGQPVAQLDAYSPLHDPVGVCYDAKISDVGIHLLMNPFRQVKGDLSSIVVLTFCRMFFRQTGIYRVIAEPDQRNRAATLLLRRLRFHFHGNIQLPLKQAALFSMQREDFGKLHSSYPLI